VWDPSRLVSGKGTVRKSGSKEPSANVVELVSLLTDGTACRQESQPETEKDV
jgi:hypothetical protein